MIYTALVAAILAVVTRCEDASGFEAKWAEYFPYSTYINTPNTFKVYWKDHFAVNNTKNDFIEFGLEVMSTGWIALGISPNSKMTNSDIMFGFIDYDGKAHLYDMHTGSTRSTPDLDNEDNLELIEGGEYNGKTFLRFKRPKYPCESNNEDLQVIIGTTRLIWAYNENKPIIKDGLIDLNSIIGHTNQEMGRQSLNLNNGFQTGYSEDVVDKDAKVYDILMDKHEIESDYTTTYWCELFEFPKVDKVNHIIKFEPVIQKGHEALVHHILVYECNEKWVNPENVGHGAVCGEWSHNMPSRQCIGAVGTSAIHTVYVWAVGMNNNVLPDNVGIEIGGDKPDALKYGIVEMHYDNPEKLLNMYDNSGFRIYYTPNLRQYSGGFISVGHMFDQRHFVPKHHKTINYGYCMSDCTGLEGAMPKDGVTIFNSFIHMHPIGAAAKLRHIRNGVELAPIDMDMAYDFDYQQMVKIENVKIMPGDDLIMECHENNYRNRTTFGGIETSTEMCITFLWVYPKPKLITCYSSFTQNQLDRWSSIAKEKGYLNKDANVKDLHLNYFNHNMQNKFEYDITMDGAITHYETLWHSWNYNERLLLCFDNLGNTIWDEPPDGYFNHSQIIPESRAGGIIEYKEDELCYDASMMETSETGSSIYETLETNPWIAVSVVFIILFIIAIGVLLYFCYNNSKPKRKAYTQSSNSDDIETQAVLPQDGNKTR